MITVNRHIHKPAYRLAHQSSTHSTSAYDKSLLSKVKATDKARLSSSASTVIKAILALLICVSSVSVQAAIINDSTERRIQVRQGNDSSNAYIKPAATFNNNAGINMLNGDSMQGLIAQKQREFEFDSQLSIEESKRINMGTFSSNNNYSSGNNPYNNNATIDFNSWLNSDRYRAQQVANYQRYLNAQVGAQNVPPLEQLLTTARSWDKCGYEPYQLPPQELWSNIVPTLRLYSLLKNQGILPASTEIRSVYRSPGLNDCAGGAGSSKHMTAGAMDIWVPEYENNLWRLSKMQDGLCQFWQYQGESYNFGLGLYSTGAIHLDTQGHRKWGFNHASSSSSCRY